MTSQPDRQLAIRMLALTLFSGVQPRLFEVLLRHYGNIERIFNADAGSLMAIAGMTTDIANRVANAKARIDQAGRYYDELAARDIKTVTRFDASYPDRLFELNDPPSLMFYRGDLPSQSTKTVALAGSQKASNEGIELTVEIARRFSEAGVQVIASLARGIDSAAHLGSKAANGISFSVLQSGLDNIHPEDSYTLATDVAREGGLMSEFAPEKKFAAGNFETSNRIIAALSQAVVVTEFYNDSSQTMDLLKCCSQIGKLAFIMIDPRYGALTDKDGLNRAVTYGAIPMVGLDKTGDIIQALV